MKKLKNHYLKQSQKYAQLHNAQGKVVFEGIFLKRYHVSGCSSVVWLLKGGDGRVHSFIELSFDYAVVVGPLGISQAKALDNYLLFEKNGRWYGQYFNKDEKIFLGKPICLNGRTTIESFLFYQSKVLYFADNNQLKRYDCLSYEKVESIYDVDELLLVKDCQDRVFLFDDRGMFETKFNILFYQKAGGGVILRKLKGKYKILYEGKFLQEYNVDEYYLDGEKREAGIEPWYSENMFIVPDDDDAVTGTLYKIEKNKVKKLASGKLRFIFKRTSRKKLLPLEEGFVQIGDETYQFD